MNDVVHVFGRKPKNQNLLDSFVRWQCRVRQIAMRESQGLPDDAIKPSLYFPDDSEAMGQIITVLSKWEAYSKTAELRHMVRRTNDPAQRREKALEYFSETYYQHAYEFSDTLTATFQPNSPGAATIVKAGNCILKFDAYSQQYTLHCKVKQLAQEHPQYQATWWHNVLFNPDLHPDTIVLAFEPDWDSISSDSATE